MRLKSFSIATMALLLTAVAPLPMGLPIFRPTVVIGQTLQSQQAEADRLLTQGIDQLNTSQYSAARQSWEQALALYRALNNPHGEALALMNLGLAYWSVSQYDQAIVYYDQALPVFRQLEDHNSEGLALLNLGLVYWSLSQYDRAIVYYDQALPLFQQVSNVYGQALVLNNLGLSYWSMSQYDQAIGYYKQALPLFQQVNNVNGEGLALMNLGLSYWSMSQYERAIDYYEQALPRFQQVNNRNNEAKVLMNLGLSYASLSQYERSIRYYEQALPIYQQVGDRNGEAKALNNLGLAYWALSQHDRAIRYYDEALPIYRQVKDRNSEALVLMNLGLVYSSLAQYPRAIAYYDEALPIFQQVKDHNGEAKVLNNLGLAYWSSSQYDRAIAYYEQSLPIYRQVKDRNNEARSLMNLGLVYWSTGQPERAMTYYNQALPIYQQVKDRNGEALVLMNLGLAYAFLAQYDRAIAAYQQALPIFQQVQDRDGEAKTLGNWGNVLYATGDLAQAEKALMASIVLKESIRADSGNDTNKVSIFEGQSYTYQSLQQVLIAENKPEQALEIAERGRARAFVELLAGRLNPSLAVNPITIAEIKRIAQEQQATVVEYSLINQKTLYIWVVSPSGQVNFAQTDLSRLPSDGNRSGLEVLIDLSRSEDIGTQGRGISFVEDPTIVARAIGDLRTQTTSLEHLQQLYTLLIKPIAAYLPKDPNQHLILIPQGELFFVPFPALQDTDGTSLIEQHTLSAAPAIQVLQLTHQQHQRLTTPRDHLRPQDILIVGNPKMPSIGNPPRPLNSLPGAEEEAKIIASLLHTSPLIGAQATEAEVVRRMQSARLIHLATHGLLDDYRGLGVPGAIALAPNASTANTPNGETINGLLTASEILTLKLQSDLIVLSACDTGRGRITGDGVIGLSRSLISAGAPSVIVSLWKVPDDSTSFLMQEFYKNFQQGKLDKAQALRQAMLSTKNQFPDPKDWAAFTLIGEIN